MAGAIGENDTMSDGILTTKPVRPASSNTPPQFRLPPLSCDVHCHVFEPGYPHVSRPHYTFPEATLEQYLALCRFLGIERMVLVQPSFYGTDNSLLLHALERIGSRGRGVVMVEEDISEVELDRFHALGVRAIRLDLFARASWSRADLRTYILHMLDRARPRGWHIQFYTPGYVVRDLLPFLATLEHDFVIDHMGYMLEEDGLTERDFAQLLDVMKTGNAWLKLSGPYRIAKHRGYEAVAHLAREIVAARPERALWGSDWPHLPDGTRDTGELVNLLLSWAPSEATRQQILVESPRRLFGFD
jgi:predicted TIM-barrel fold metal-dependent hydrolase